MRKLAIEFLIVTYLMTCFACQSDNTTYQFVLLEKDKTGLDFSNNLSYNNDMNVFNYMYTYNGGGIGAADFNNDGSSKTMVGQTVSLL